jgi:hypothetical protein
VLANPDPLPQATALAYSDFDLKTAVQTFALSGVAQMPRKSTAPAPESLYSVHPSIAYAQAILANLPTTTGKSMAEWVRLLKEQGPVGEKERREWLKKQHQLGGTTAWMIAEAAEGKGGESTDPAVYLKLAAEYVEAMYADSKAALRPIHDALIKLGASLGNDVKVCPCQTIVPLYRHHVFAQIKPTTRTRIDLGLALKGSKETPPERLIDTGGLKKGDRITHRIPINSVKDVDAEVKDWLKRAYDLDAKD